MNIRLTEERWEHICENHQLEKHKEEVLDTINNPDYVYAAPADIRPQFIAMKKFPEMKTYGLTLNMVVHYRELNKDGFVITAFTMSKKKLVKKVKKWSKAYPK